MARYTDAKCRLCRREGMKLFLKGARCFTDKCAIERRNYPPGQHGLNRGKLTPFGVQLREKQKAKRIYGVVEGQFRSYFHEAEREKGVTGENLLRLLELRLDNVVYRANFAASRNQARQFVRHGHVTVNGKRVNVSSYITKPGEVVAIKNTPRSQQLANRFLDLTQGVTAPDWMTVDRDKLTCTINRQPEREEIQVFVNEQLVVELYSR